MNEELTPLEKQAQLYAKCDPDLQKWAQAQGIENLKMRMEVMKEIGASSSSTLTLLLAGIGGFLAYAARIADQGPSATTAGAAVVCGYLVLLAGVLFWKCIRLADAPAVYYEPKDVLRVGDTPDSLRAGDLADLQGRLAFLKRRNRARGDWLDRVRGAALLTPVAFAATVWIYRILGG